MSHGARGGRGVLWTLFRYEIRMVVRDTRMILIAVVLPLVLFPGIILVMKLVGEREERRLEEAVYEYALAGDESEWGRAIVLEALRLDTEDTDTTRAPARFEEVESANPDSLLRAGGIHVLVEAFSAAAYDSIRRDDLAWRDSARAAVPTLRLGFRAQSDFSRNAQRRLQERILEVRSALRDSVYRVSGLPVEPALVAVVEADNTASAEREAGAFLGLALTPFLLFLMLSGGSIVAVDAISGEKERGTLETLLTTAATRREIVVAKQLAIVAVGLAVAAINVLNLLVYLVLGVFELPASFAVALSAVDLVLIFVLFVPLTVLVSSSLLLLSGYSKSYKEYQIYFFPLFLLFLFPSLASMLPGMDLRSAIAFVPVAGIGVAVREVMVGERDWLFLAVAFLSTAGTAAFAARLTERALSTERLITGAELDEADLTGGPALFPRHVLKWFGVLWVVFFIAAMWYGEALGIRGQLVFNLLVIFFGGSLLMIRRYRLSFREAFALRAPHPAAWLAVLVGAPSGFIVGIGLANLVNLYLFPVPESVLEAFGEVMLGEDMPLWQLVLFLAVMPGIFEELAFRGVLLHGLRKRMRPWLLCLVVGGVFGLFHVSLFRLIPTAYLGA
ncbi:MAG TPA: ABC transporter permease subunit, partial [Longimicrobiales bacterium]